MWRREERLKYWLEGGGQSQKPGLASGLVRKLSLILRPGNRGNSVSEEPLSMRAEVISPASAFIPTIGVKDGLDALGNLANPALESTSGSGDCSGRVHTVELFGNGRALDLALPNEQIARIRQEKVDMAAHCRPVLLNLRTAEVHELNHPYNAPPQLRDGSRFLMQNPSVHILTSKMSELPHARTSVRVEELQDSERAGFLREAEALKGIAADRAELVAVFRHVPIEIISRLRFFADKKAILYSISRESQLTRTRVHDMGAVQDVESSEIHLIPHRTRFRAVSLN